MFINTKIFSILLNRTKEEIIKYSMLKRFFIWIIILIKLYIFTRFRKPLKNTHISYLINRRINRPYNNKKLSINLHLML